MAAKRTPHEIVKSQVPLETVDGTVLNVVLRKSGALSHGPQTRNHHKLHISQIKTDVSTRYIIITKNRDLKGPLNQPFQRAQLSLPIDLSAKRPIVNEPRCRRECRNVRCGRCLPLALQLPLSFRTSNLNPDLDIALLISTRPSTHLRLIASTW